ncbi:SIMPL domain-containing protein [Olivibacter sp. SDN3]|uniref:SIMPL domain-containing protein n=1 Tax=Olivibacter sp. SDN3 TaxID=2764720 RepID=UPI001651B0C1|nr:SIMPL domain-containing protein [Olivibacter sp. SDN3]QNL50107.1 SIMPL domain-containing protein [Olivibacter sp. SDN3]
MKKLVIAMVLGAITLSASAQNVDTRRKIEVYGSAEEEVTPDIIYVAISLKEYFKDSNNKNKITIDELEKQLALSVKKAGIKEEDFTINNISSYAQNDPKKKKDPGFLASKQYRIKVSNLNAINTILDGVDAQGIQSTSISGYEHSKITEIKNELRIRAVNNAKEKASVMAQALGDTLGQALEVTDTNTDAGSPQPMMYKPMAARGESADYAEQPMEIDFKTIKINYQFRVVFELK